LKYKIKSKIIQKSSNQYSHIYLKHKSLIYN
jgi:hypothetical protein